MSHGTPSLAKASSTTPTARRIKDRAPVRATSRDVARKGEALDRNRARASVNLAAASSAAMREWLRE